MLEPPFFSRRDDSFRGRAARQMTGSSDWKKDQ